MVFGCEFQSKTFPLKQVKFVAAERTPIDNNIFVNSFLVNNMHGIIVSKPKHFSKCNKTQIMCPLALNVTTFE